MMMIKGIFYAGMRSLYYLYFAHQAIIGWSLSRSPPKSRDVKHRQSPSLCFTTCEVVCTCTLLYMPTARELLTTMSYIIGLSVLEKLNGG